MVHRSAASKAVPVVRAETNQPDALFCFARSMASLLALMAIPSRSLAFHSARRID